MNKRAEPESEPFCLWAVIPVIGQHAERVQWKLQAKSLAAMAIEVAISITRIKRIVIATSREIEDIYVDTRLDIMEVDASFPEINNLKLCSKVFEKFRRMEDNGADCNGMVILDPSCPLRCIKDVNGAIDLYASQKKQPRPWLDVISVDLLPNHFHPRKILKLTEGGNLDYFNKEGKKVFQRQQLEGDDYFRKNKTVHIYDPMAVTHANKRDKGFLGYIIEEPVVRVKDKASLDLAKALINSV